jgi:CRP-like cAMP-binding protein
MTHEGEKRMTETSDHAANPYGLTKQPSPRSDKDVVFAALRKIPVFNDLPQEDLEWFVARTDEFHFEPGEALMHEGDPAELMVALLEGEIRGRKERGSGDDSLVFTVEAPWVTGLLPYSRMKSYTFTIRATLPTWILAYHHSKFPELLQHLPELSQRLVGMLTDRVRTVTEAEQQSQKLAAIGKLSAGLAHE